MTRVNPFCTLNLLTLASVLLPILPETLFPFGLDSSTENHDKLNYEKGLGLESTKYEGMVCSLLLYKGYGHSVRILVEFE